MINGPKMQDFNKHLGHRQIWNWCWCIANICVCEQIELMNGQINLTNMYLFCQREKKQKLQVALALARALAILPKLSPTRLATVKQACGAMGSWWGICQRRRQRRAPRRCGDSCRAKNVMNWQNLPGFASIQSEQSKLQRRSTPPWRMGPSGLH